MSQGARIGLAIALCTLGMLAAPGDIAAQTLSDVFDRVHLSVVVIRTLERDIGDDGATLVVSQGSGVLVSAGGLVMTAAHLVQAASVVEVQFLSGGSVPARIVASEPGADVSLLKVDRVPDGAGVAVLADSDRARIGEQVFVVGAPYGLSATLTVGHLSGRLKPGPVSGLFEVAEFLQTDAAINQGNSGGPLFNAAGEVLGIVSHLITKSGGFEGLGFVVASNTARRLLLEQPVPWFGIDAVLLEGTMARLMNLPASGLLIQRVAADSPAEKMGLRGGVTRGVIGDRTLILGGDVILAVQGVAVDEFLRRRAISALKSGSPITLTRMRAGRTETISVEVP
ncbi:MAG TPA: trypsin-like peptidase domain-containing protein [Gaiellales bacterium]|nr:trypsin-like peptidase domain-containing protein [Gaiellales bacterium]